MICLLYTILNQVLGYEETLTFISIDAYNTLSILNFTDEWTKNSVSIYQDLQSFPLPIYQILEDTSAFSVIYCWGIRDILKFRLQDYKYKTGRTLKDSQPGLSVFAKTENWHSFSNKLSAFLKHIQLLIRKNSSWSSAFFSKELYYCLTYFSICMKSATLSLSD